MTAITERVLVAVKNSRHDEKYIISMLASPRMEAVQAPKQEEKPKRGRYGRRDMTAA